jgi:hypothetical protein
MVYFNFVNCVPSICISDSPHELFLWEFETLPSKTIYFLEYYSLHDSPSLSTSLANLHATKYLHGSLRKEGKNKYIFYQCSSNIETAFLIKQAEKGHS